MERIGIYGGTFNPPHLGHMLAASEAVKKLGLDCLLLIPDCAPPHKGGEEILVGAERLKLLSLSSDGIPNCQVSDLELRRGGISYTVDTVKELHKLNPEAKLYLIMGTDMFLSFANWKEPKAICKLANLVVLHRTRDKQTDTLKSCAKHLEKAMDAKVTILENDALPVSSTELRRMLVFRCAGPLMAPKAIQYIEERNLYAVNDDRKNLPAQELEREVCRLLAPRRVAHVLGCRDTAVKLAEHYGANTKDAERAGLLHDVTKLLSPDQQLILCQEYGILLSDFYRKNPKILHALTGAAVAERIFFENPAVCSAIRWHTTGRAGMTLLEKIIYTADYMEPNRDFDGVDKLRKLAFSDIDQAVCMGIQMSVDILKKDGRSVSPDSLAAVEDLSK